MMKYLYFVRLAPKVNVKNRNIIRNICHDENLKKFNVSNQASLTKHAGPHSKYLCYSLHPLK